MPARKPAERRQGRGTDDVGAVETTAPRKIPPAPHPSGRKLLASTVTAWTTFWQSKMATLVEPADQLALARLFRMYDLRERMERTLLAKPFVEGSTGQIVVHPAAKEVASLDARIDKLEPRFGLTPKGRLELGITFGAAVASLEEINRGFDEDDGTDQEEDPRRRAIDTTGT